MKPRRRLPSCSTSCSTNCSTSSMRPRPRRLYLLHPRLPNCSTNSRSSPRPRPFRLRCLPYHFHIDTARIRCLAHCRLALPVFHQDMGTRFVDQECRPDSMFHRPRTSWSSSCHSSDCLASNSSRVLRASRTNQDKFPISSNSEKHVASCTSPIWFRGQAQYPRSDPVTPLFKPEVQVSPTPR